MNKRTNLMAVAMVFILTLSIFTAIAATSTKVEAALTPTQVWVKASNPTPCTTDKYDLTVRLTTGPNLDPVSGKSIDVWVRHSLTVNDAAKIWTVTTGSDGRYTIKGVGPSPKPAWIRAVFNGDTNYQSSKNADLYAINPKVCGSTKSQATRMTISTSAKAEVYHPTYFTAKLEVLSVNGWTALSNQPISISHYIIDPQKVRYIVYHDYTSVTTDANGQFHWTPTFTASGVRVYTAAFSGASQLGASSTSLNVPVKWQTRVHMWATPVNPKVNQEVGFGGILERYNPGASSSGWEGVPNKYVTVQHTVSWGEQYTDGQFKTHFAYVAGGSTMGYYGFSTTFSWAGDRQYTSSFAGDDDYWSSQYMGLTIHVT